MAPAPLTMPPGYVFKPSGRQLITLYLRGQALRGELSDAVIPGGCYIAAGVDVFSASPDALPFQPSHRRQHGEVWGYFSAAQPADDIQPAPGGCWVRCSPEKGYEYEQGGEAFGFRRRFAFHVTRLDGDGRVMWAHTRWLMKEYRLNKGAAFRRALPGPKANMDFVVRKVFTKPVLRAQPPARASGALQRGGGRLPPRASRPPRPPKANKNLVVSRVSTKPVVPLPPPPPARSSEQGNPGSNQTSLNEEAGCSNDKDQTRNRAVCVSKPSGRQVMRQYLGPKAVRGELPEGIIPGYVVEGVDIFSTRPDALPFQSSHRGEHGEVWGYFSAVQPTDDMRPVPGGCWVRYGTEKRYWHDGEALALRRTFAFHMAWLGGDGRVMSARSRWLMKEYRLNKGAAAFRRVQPGPKANMDCVVHKVFMKPVVPPALPLPPPPARSSEYEAGGPSAACPPLPARSSENEAGSPSAATCPPPPDRSSENEAGGPSAATCPLQQGGEPGLQPPQPGGGAGEEARSI